MIEWGEKWRGIRLDFGQRNFNMDPLITIVSVVITISILLVCWWGDVGAVRSSLDYYWGLKYRVPLDNESFYEYYYSGSDVPREVVDQIRAFHERNWNIDASTIRPTDRVTFIQPQLDPKRLIEELEEVFDLEPSTNGQRLKDETFDGIVKYVLDHRTS
jgi:hypothetical protein